MIAPINRDLLDRARTLAGKLQRRGQEQDAALVDQLATELEREWRVRFAAGERSPLTRVQRQVLSYIESYHEAHGIAPTLAEIGRKTGRAQSTVHEHLGALEAKGYIRRDHNQNRSVVLLAGREEVAA